MQYGSNRFNSSLPKSRIITWCTHWSGKNCGFCKTRAFPLGWSTIWQHLYGAGSYFSSSIKLRSSCALLSKLSSTFTTLIRLCLCRAAFKMANLHKSSVSFSSVSKYPILFITCYSLCAFQCFRPTRRTCYDIIFAKWQGLLGHFFCTAIICRGRPNSNSY